MDLHDRLKADRPDLAARMVFMSGGAFTERAARFLQGPGRSHVEKPFDSARLRDLVRGLVAARAGG